MQSYMCVHGQLRYWLIATLEHIEITVIITCDTEIHVVHKSVRFLKACFMDHSVHLNLHRWLKETVLYAFIACSKQWRHI